MTKQLIPKRRFKGFVNDWKVVTIKDLGNRFFGGGTPNTSISKYWSGDIPWLQSSDLLDDKLKLLRINKKISQEGLDNSAAQLIPATSIAIVTRVGVGKVAYLPYAYATSQDFLSISHLKLDGLYAVYSLYKLLQKQKKLVQGTSIKGLTKDELLSIEIKVTESLEEQQKIGEFFKLLDARIANQKRKIEKIKALKQAYLTEMFSQEGKEIPLRRFSKFIGSWKQKKIQELGAVITGSTPSTKNLNYYSENGMIWVTPTDIEGRITFDTEKKLSLEGQKKSRIAPKGTILITSIASIGKNTILGVEGSFNQQINALIPKKGMDSYFLFASSYWWSVRLKQMASEGTMQIVNKSEFSNLSTLLPTLEEQQKIGEFFKTLDEKIESEEKKLEKLKKMKEAFLEEMFV